MTTKKSYFRKPLALLVLAALGASMMILLASPAWAAAITVNTTANELNSDGDCSLREAVEAANTNAAVDGCAAGSGSELDTIEFAVGRGQTITLAGVRLDIQDDAGLTINGQKKNITIRGSGASQVPSITPTLFVVDPGTVFNLKNLTVADAHSTHFSGALNNDRGNVKVINSTFSGNSAIEFNGGGIANFGTLTVINSTFSENSAGSIGGAILNDPGCCDGGTLKVINSTFSGNSATHAGGAIINNAGGTLTVSNSTFSGNSAGGSNGGGGIANDGTLNVSKSTFSENSAGGLGGAILTSCSSEACGALTVSNSTFSGNSAAGSNGGGGIHSVFSTTTLKNTIIANSTQGGDCTIGEGGTIVDRGFNLIEDGSCLTAASSRSGDPLLGALAENGGPTQTMALQEGSPAIDKGKAFGATTDQRGLPRPADFPLIRNRGDGSDVGAYEVQP
jgi:CSLREA domain-containing protein